MLCKCDSGNGVEQIGKWDGCPLDGGGHTAFIVERCLNCGGVCGFPQSNFELALKDGTPETKQKLAAIVEDI